MEDIEGDSSAFICRAWFEDGDVCPVWLDNSGSFQTTSDLIVGIVDLKSGAVLWVRRSEERKPF
jgi:hypothetical protein